MSSNVSPFSASSPTRAVSREKIVIGGVEQGGVEQGPVVGSGLPSPVASEGHWDRRDGLPSRKSAHPPSSTSEADQYSHVSRVGEVSSLRYAYTRWSSKSGLYNCRNATYSVPSSESTNLRGGSAAASGSGGWSSSTACCSASISSSLDGSSCSSSSLSSPAALCFLASASTAGRCETGTTN